MIATAHPDTARLAAYGAGRLAPVDAAAVEEHLRGCDACGERMDQLARDPFLSALCDAAAFGPPNGSGCAVDAPTVACFGDATVVPDELAAHPRYRLGELLGRGGMGAVYKAEHTLMERPVAIKLIDSRLLEQPGSAERFKAEVKTAAKLHHPNIVTAHDAEQVGSVTVLVMEFVEGRTLADVLRDRGPLPVAEACAYARQAAAGLAHAHTLGMVHRDVKPHNLMLTPDGRVKILDFGLARFLSEEPADGGTPPSTETVAVAGRLTQTGACMGTLDYMAPEQAKDARTADARADVYSLGCTLYHLLTGQVPYPGGTGTDKLHRIRTEEPIPLSALRPDAPPELSAVIGRMMAKAPGERYASAADVADALARFTREAEPRPAVSRRRPWRRFAAVVALVLAGVAVAIAMKPPAKRVEPAADVPAVAPAAALPVAPAPRAVVVRPIPPELDLIPREAAGFLTLPVQEVLTAPSLAWARKRLFAGGELAEMVKLVTQLDLTDITRATVIWPTADHVGWNVMAVPGEIPSRLVVLTTAAAIDKSNLWLQAGKGTEEYRGRRYVLDPDGWTAIFVADDRTLVFGSRASVRLVIDRLADPKPGPLDGAVRTAADGPKRVVLGVQGPKVRRVLADNVPPQLQLAAPAYTADRVTVAIDLRDEPTIDFLGAFATEAAAADGHAALVKAFAAGAEELDVQVGQFPPDDENDADRAEEQKHYRDFLTQTRDAFRIAKPERTGTQLRLTFVSRSAFAGGMVLPGIGYVLMPTGPSHFAPAAAGKNDATVARALLAYHAKHGRFPPPAILSKEGKPLLSWRVALLPHLGDEAAALYKKFNLEEGWDSPANKMLLDRMPAELCTDPLKTDYRPRPHTGYRVYTAKGSVFEGPGGLSKQDITDDPAATILAVRFMQPVPWTKPDQLTFDNLETIPSAAIFADGTVERLAGNEDPNTLKAMITRAGGEKMKPKPDPIPKSAPYRQVP